MSMDFAVVVPWHRKEVMEAFRHAWDIPDREPDWLIMQHDADGDGCAVTKNRGIDRALVRGAQVVVVLDDDCYPTDEAPRLEVLARKHIELLDTPAEVRMFTPVTAPWSRGTPYANLTTPMPVAASMGYWTEVGDYCAARQLVHQNAPMDFMRGTVFGRYFPLCGMNLAFRPDRWWPWWQFINVDRFDDIWQGWLWQKRAYHEGYCFNLGGPLVRHSRQSNVWANLRAEAEHLEANEHLWETIFQHSSVEYEPLRALLPV